MRFIDPIKIMSKDHLHKQEGEEKKPHDADTKGNGLSISTPDELQSRMTHILEEKKKKRTKKRSRKSEEGAAEEDSQQKSQKGGPSGQEEAMQESAKPQKKAKKQKRKKSKEDEMTTVTSEGNGAAEPPKEEETKSSPEEEGRSQSATSTDLVKKTAHDDAIIEEQKQIIERWEKALAHRKAAMSYLDSWYHQGTVVEGEKVTWKFNLQKLKQAWILKHLYDTTLISDDTFEILLGYLDKLAGEARARTLREARDLLACKTAPPEISRIPEVDTTIPDLDSPTPAPNEILDADTAREKQLKRAEKLAERLS